MAYKSETKRFINTDDVNFRSTGIDIEGSHFTPGLEGEIIETTTGWGDKTDVLHHKLPLTIGHNVQLEDGSTVVESVIFQESIPA